MYPPHITLGYAGVWSMISSVNDGRWGSISPRYGMLLLVLDPFELVIKGFDTVVDSFLKGVGSLVGNEIRLLGYGEAYDGLLVERGFRFNHFKGDFGGHHIGITT